MNLVNEIKDIKFNYKPNSVILDLQKEQNLIKVVDLIYSTQNQYILDSNNINSYIQGRRREINIITEIKNIQNHINFCYNMLNSSAGSQDTFKESCENIDWLTTYICALFDLTHVKRITFYFFEKYAFTNVFFDDGNNETFIHLNIFFEQTEENMNKLKKDIEPFGQEKELYKQSVDCQNSKMITEIFSGDFSIFPYEAVYQTMIDANNTIGEVEKEKEKETNE